MTRFIALVLTAISLSCQAGESIKIGNNVQLMVDDALIERQINGERVYHRPTPKEVAITTDAPWEGNVSAYFTFLQDGDVVDISIDGIGTLSNPIVRKSSAVVV